MMGHLEDEVFDLYHLHQLGEDTEEETYKTALSTTVNSKVSVIIALKQGIKSMNALRRSKKASTRVRRQEEAPLVQ